ncbi:MAG: polyketide synthase, partial [Flavobacteriales bacterium]|nr:polyketide synthase [Flavobacteriales bacterium]
MDPQQRLLLEVTWEALEDAAIPPSSLMNSETGVFIGICSNDYGDEALNKVDNFNAYSGTGNFASVASGRISYLLGLRGPSIALDTACSSSLVAMHLAVQSLRAGESDLALAGGVNLILSPNGTLYFSKIQALAADGRTKAFDAKADGYVRAEGCGVVVLKRLS